MDASRRALRRLTPRSDRRRPFDIWFQVPISFHDGVSCCPESVEIERTFAIQC
jgi:hypothetical protein